MTTDVFSPEKRSAVMRRVKGGDTSPELAVRKILRAAGIGYRLGGCGLAGRPAMRWKQHVLADHADGMQCPERMLSPPPPLRQGEGRCPSCPGRVCRVRDGAR